MKASAQRIRGGWEGLRPFVSLDGFALTDRRGKVAVGFERAEATLSWWALAVGRLRFHDVDFHRPALSLRRGADGIVYLGEKPLNAAGPGDDSAFTEWLLAQPRVGIHEATLRWRDEKSGAPEVALTGVEIAVERRHGRHHAALSAVPPRELAGRIEMRADVALTRDGKLWHAAGEAFAETRSADLALLRAHLPLPETLRSGVGSVRVWTQFADETVREVVADLNMRDAVGQLASDALPLRLASISGRARYRGEPTGFRFATEGLKFRIAGGPEVLPGNFTIARSAEAGKPARLEVKADGIDVKIAGTLLDYFPVPRDVKAQVQRAHRGHGRRGHDRARVTQRIDADGSHLPRAARRRFARGARIVESRGQRAGGDDRRGEVRERRRRRNVRRHVALASRLEGALARRRGPQGPPHARERKGRGQLHAEPRVEHARLARSRHPGGHELAGELRAEGRPVAIPLRRRFPRTLPRRGRHRGRQAQVPPGLAVGGQRERHLPLREPSHGDSRRAGVDLRQPCDGGERRGRRPRRQAAGAHDRGRHRHLRRRHRALPARIAAGEGARCLHARGLHRRARKVAPEPRLSPMGQRPGACRG